jgi:hypothetical protein
MEIVDTDRVTAVPPGQEPEYDRANPLLKVFSLIEGLRFAAGREFYSPDQIHYLFPFQSLELYGPSHLGSLDPRQQDQKEDFQKQNVKSVTYGAERLSRGWVVGDSWSTPFLRMTYRGGPDTRLSELAEHRLGDHIKVWVKVGNFAMTQPIVVPYHPETHRYTVELWGDPKVDLRGVLDSGGLEALDRGELVVRPDLIHGHPVDFVRERLEGVSVRDVSPDCTMHPVRPLTVELAWSDLNERVWDTVDGVNHRYRFGMALRGWDNFLKVGRSQHPHGGPGSLEYRDLFTNYFGGLSLEELSHDVHSWQFDARGHKGGSGRESFFAVNYMNLNLVRPGGGIGLHRHRDSSEAFFAARGRGLMVTGDWCKYPDRDRALEVRQLREGHMTLIHGGQLHGLLNPTDEDLTLFTIGAYD